MTAVKKAIILGIDNLLQISKTQIGYHNGINMVDSPGRYSWEYQRRPTLYHYDVKIMSWSVMTSIWLTLSGEYQRRTKLHNHDVKIMSWSDTRHSNHSITMVF